MRSSIHGGCLESLSGASRIGFARAAQAHILPAVTLLLVVLLPFLGVLLSSWTARYGRNVCAWATAAPPALALALLSMQAPAVFRGERMEVAWPWLPSAGLELAFVLDGYALLFAGLVLGIGLLVILYARYYLSETDPVGRFYAMLAAFMGAMLGVVLSNNLLLLVLFWELTSISSFLLIGYWRHLAEARRGARMALAVTGAGGLCLFGGALLLGHMAGSFELTTVLASAETVQEHPYYELTLILVLLGAFSKSAQVPFHFWLPHAMAAPTPVSAYLHSATMVKAGVFLLGRLWPVLAGSDLWFFTVTGVGLATLVFGAYSALFKNDLKGLLAYSTISHLGLITLLFGLGTAAGAVAAVFHIINHAIFKASLFMSAGIIDHEAGTRDIRRLGGLRHGMPHTMALASVAAASMAGVPLLNGFLSKEMFFAEVVVEGERLGHGGWVLPVIATLGGLLSVAYSIRFVHDVFFGEVRDSLPKHPHEPPRYMRVPVEVLIALCVVVGIAPDVVIRPLLDAAVAGVLNRPAPHYSLALWHGFNVPVVMSLVALAGGTLLYKVRDAAERTHERVFPSFSGKQAFDLSMSGLRRMADAITRALDDGSVQRNVAWLLAACIAAVVAAFWRDGLSFGTASLTPAPAVAVAAWAMLSIVLVALVLLHRRRVLALVLVGVVGLLSAVTFVYISAPDLALTQISIEVVSVVLLLQALQHLPDRTPRESTPGRRLRDAVLAVAGGGGIGLLAYALMTRPFDSISDYYLEHSLTEGGGANVVNVILVDFRGFDTFGEITVLSIAAAGIYAMLPDRSSTFQGGFGEYSHPLMLRIGSRLMLPMMGAVALYIFLRGHQSPGGGFIAGLVAAVGLVTQYMASGMRWAETRFTSNYFPIVAGGLLTAGLTGLASWAFGRPFLTSAFTHLHWPVVGDLEVASAMGFDLGVFLVVVGSVMLILAHIGRQPRSLSPD